VGAGCARETLFEDLNYPKLLRLPNAMHTYQPKLLSSLAPKLCLRFSNLSFFFNPVEWLSLSKTHFLNISNGLVVYRSYSRKGDCFVFFFNNYEDEIW